MKPNENMTWEELWEINKANRLAKLEKALDLAKEFIKDTLSPFVYKSLLEEITQTLDKTEINTITKGDNDE